MTDMDKHFENWKDQGKIETNGVRSSMTNGADGKAREEGNSERDVVSSSHTNGSRGFGNFSFHKEEGEEPTLPAKQTENYVVTDPKTRDGHRGLFHYIYDLIRGDSRWRRSIHISDNVEGVVDPDRTWQARMSLIFLKLLWVLNGPLKTFGHFLEDTLNFFLANGGVFKTLFLVLFHRHRLVIRDRESEDYASFIGVLDPRVALLSAGTPSTRIKSNEEANAIDFPGTDYGSKFTVDVFVMASKLAYENAKFVENVVTNTWKMNFVGFYNCWNEFQKQKNTQVFLFTDRPQNARAIVVAFRGTEPFNAIDWSTDFDFSWFEIPGLGKIHVGFLEALGLGDRKRMETFVSMCDRARSQRTNSHSDSAMSGLPADVVADQDKKLAYDDVTLKVKELISQNPDAKLFVTGHSLGGALANLYTALLFFNKEEVVTSRYGALYTFGQPRVGGEIYAKYLIDKVQLSRYWRVVFANDLVPRIPFDDLIFQFKHSGYCYYYDELYAEKTVRDTPNANYFSWRLSTIIALRLGALYDLIMSIFSRWVYGPGFREGYTTIFVRCFGLFLPGMCGHLLNNYVNSVRLGPALLEAKLHDEYSGGPFGFIHSFFGARKEKYNTATVSHED
ncbi:hypothetical protein R1flu_000518 [Riccia fluitans]|uniref:Fungal lipase-type domain-containing protein n=1 Tax=Riccia fluitans TaxID=41844 RepID=A0ABD1Y0W0_9MARC